MGSSWIRGQTHVPCFGRQILNHWTTREVRSVLFDEHVEKRWEECQPACKGGCIGQDIPAGLRDTGPCLETFLSQIEGRVAAGIWGWGPWMLLNTLQMHRTALPTLTPPHREGSVQNVSSTKFENPHSSHKVISSFSLCQFPKVSRIIV